ncbi:SWI/SNF complex subunit SWI3D [Ananas comosus]|uniref:SWI/SNF complex subunit SWI3D n=1 Tax=Ananas comosus TaxID=4615 RepID=A0A199VJG4_ANACO|nr:SWI/SNF complex subunit SWI3D [Ananas comosus]
MPSDLAAPVFMSSPLSPALGFSICFAVRWFSWSAIHPIEKQTLASFFNGKSEKRTPEIYLEIRNSIMQKFHADPNVQMELKDFSELSVGDADAKQEVFEFLDHWGLINFHPFPPSGTNDSKSDGDNGDDKMSSIVDKLYQFDTVQSYINSAHKKAEPTMPAPPPSLISETALADALVITLEPSVEYHCNSCSADCSRKRYHCQTQVLIYVSISQADFDLCIDCFNERKFDPGMSPADFILMGPAEAPGASGANWTDQETLLLLEALELFGENWSEIAEHVATKTKVQCMLHFLQMPIEDSFLDGDDEINESIQEKAETTSADKELASTTVPEKMEVENQVEEKEKKKKKKKKKTAKMKKNLQMKSRFAYQSDTDDTEKKNTDNISSESASDSAVDALKSAFQAVGFFSENGELGSFAEAGNPVMALAAFLVALVEHDNAITSCRSSLKAISEESPAIQLATRHCFILEDPPGDMKRFIVFLLIIAVSLDNTVAVCAVLFSKEQSEENALSLEKKMDPSALTKGELKLPDEKVLAVPPTNNTKESVVLDSQEAAESLEKKMNDLKSVGEEKPLNVKVGDLDSQDKGEIDTLKSKDTGAAPLPMGTRVQANK